MEGLWGSKDNLEQEVISLWGDETCKLHRTCSLLSSCKTGTRAAQVSQEICYLSAMHRNQQAQSQIGMMRTPLEIQHLNRSGQNFQKSDFVPSL